MKYYSVFVLIWLCIVMLFSLGLSNNASKTVPKSKYELPNREAAINKALEYTGFNLAIGLDKAQKSEAELIMITSDNTPYYKCDKLGSKVWQIRFNNIPIGQQGPKEKLRSFEVLLDEASGNLIKIISISENCGSSDTIPQPSKNAAEKFFDSRRFVFNGSPKENSHTTFWEALQLLKIANPANTKVIIAYYWDLNISETSIPFAWLIIQRGISNPLPTSHGNPFEDRYVNLKMSVIDAKLGTSILATNAPYDPEDVKE